MLKKLHDIVGKTSATRADSTRQAVFLKLITQGHSLSEILASLCRWIEEQTAQYLCAIHLWEKGNLQWAFGSAVFEESIQSSLQSLKQLSFGTCQAAVREINPVFIEDIAIDPRCETNLDLAYSIGIKASASWPILGSKQQLLGTIAIHSREMGRPSTEDQEFVDLCSSLAAIAIERTHLEDGLRKSEGNLAAAQRIARMGSWETDLNDPNNPGRNVLRWSDEVFRIFGYEPGQISATRENFFEAVHPQDRSRVAAAVQQAIDNGSSYQVDHRIVLPDGTERIVHEHAQVMRDIAGQSIKLIGTVQDITERVRNDEALRRKEEVYRLITENTSDVLWLLDLETLRFKYVSPSVQKLRGFTAEEVMAQHLSDVLTRESYQLAAEKLALRLNAFCMGDESVRIMTHEFNQPCKDGSIINTEVVTTLLTNADNKPVEILGVTRNISERKRSEAAILQSERSYREIFNATSEAIFLHEAWTGNLIDVNDAMVAMYGYPSKKEVLQGNIGDLSTNEHHFTQEEAIRHIHRAMREGPQVFEWLAKKKNGDRFWVEVSLRQSEIGGNDRVLAVVRDISLRKKVESELREKGRLIAAVADNSPDYIAVFDVIANCCVYKNKNMAALVSAFGNDPADFNQDLLLQLVHVEDRVRMTRHIQHLRKADNTVLNIEYRLLKPSKDYGWFQSRDAVFKRDVNGNVVQTLSVSRDITEWKNAEHSQAVLEAQLRQAQKMEAVGQLAGGVAHDFNNIMTVILGNTSLLADDSGITHETLDLVREIGEAAGRASNLTRQLLAFSRQQVMQIRRLDLNDILANITKMLGRLLGEDISLESRFSSTPPVIEADAGMLEQIILNLAVNARDAMPNGGSLMLSTTIEDISEARAKLNSEAKIGRYVSLIVKDTGCGMAPSVLSRIFEPFYTTKAKGKGTGLGLATVYGIVKQHCGWIEVSSEVGKGTTFQVFLPVVEVKNIAVKPANDNKLSAQKGTETILVVEDEAAVRKLITSYLRRCGYQILEASNGVQAKTLWQLNADAIDLLLTDMVMPGGVSGAELAQQFLNDRPKLKIVFCSGYSYEAIKNNSNMLSRGRFLAKPFQTAMLSRVVRECLDGE